MAHLQESSKNFSDNFNILSFPTKIERDTDVAINYGLDIHYSILEYTLDLSEDLKGKVKCGMCVNVCSNLSSCNKTSGCEVLRQIGTYSNPGPKQRPLW